MISTIAHQRVPDFQNMPKTNHVEASSAHNEKNIVPCTASGQPLTLSEYNDMVDEAIAQCAAGKSLAHDAVKEMFESRQSQWKKDNAK